MISEAIVQPMRHIRRCATARPAEELISWLAEMPGKHDPRLTIRGNGRPVILVPGMNGTADLFYRQVPLLEQAYRVATYSLRDDAESLDALAADLVRTWSTSWRRRSAGRSSSANRLGEPSR